MDDSECLTCGKLFPSGPRARDQHCLDTGHNHDNPVIYGCETCPFWCYGRSECEDHMNYYDHWPHKCLCCSSSFPTAEARQEHEAEHHWYCAACDRQFENFNNIKMHLNSRFHRGQNISCPFCSRTFVTATGVAHHLESARCSGAMGLTRWQIFMIVRSKDPDGVITMELLDWEQSSEFEGTEACWNGSAYECYVCHRLFGLLGGLTQHLNSPIHQQALYQCPNPRCEIEFKNLGGFFNHLESERCGFSRFEDIQNRVADFVSGSELITF